MDVYQHVVPEEQTEATNNEDPTQTEEESTPAPVTSTTSAPKKSASSKTKQLQRICKKQKLCSKLKSKRDCPKVGKFHFYCLSCMKLVCKVIVKKTPFLRFRLKLS